MRVLGVNAVFHDPAAALVVDGRVVDGRVVAWFHGRSEYGPRALGRRPMVDDPRDALECSGSAPVDLPAIGRLVVRRPTGVPVERP